MIALAPFLCTCFLAMVAPATLLCTGLLDWLLMHPTPLQAGFRKSLASFLCTEMLDKLISTSVYRLALTDDHASLMCMGLLG